MQVTTTSRTMLQFSSRILMRGKLRREAIVPAVQARMTGRPPVAWRDFA
jgi:hypothetical protein